MIDCSDRYLKDRSQQNQGCRPLIRKILMQMRRPKYWTKPWSMKTEHPLFGQAFQTPHLKLRNPRLGHRVSRLGAVADGLLFGFIAACFFSSIGDFSSNISKTGVLILAMMISAIFSWVSTAMLRTTSKKERIFENNGWTK